MSVVMVIGMKAFKRIKFRKVCHCLAYFTMMIYYQAIGQAAVSVSPGDNIPDVMKQYPAGTTYVLEPGEYRIQQITPKDNDVFIGKPGAILNGSFLLTNWTKEGAYWTHSIPLDRPGQEYDACVTGQPACKYPEDLYKDNYPMFRDIALTGVNPGRWYFDYTNKRIYLVDDPTKHKMEIGLARRAFGGSAKHVTIRGLTVEKYAIPGHMAAIGDQYPGSGWIVEDNEVRLNHGQGISFSGPAIIRRNNVHHNGQLGIRSSNAHGALIEGNELHYNTLPEIGFKWTHEGGGSKFAVSDSLTIRNNKSHNNWGPGLWTDINNKYIVYDGNICTDNIASGIFHEISYNVIIRNNVLQGNGKVHGGQILLSTSNHGEIYNNKIIIDKNSGDGIKIVQRDRGTDYIGTNNYVHHNNIIYLVDARTTGAWADFDTDNFWKNGNVLFDYDHYHIAVSDDPKKHRRWEWGGKTLDFSGFQGFKQELHGTVDNDVMSALDP